MELLGWILAGIAGVFSTGLVIGVVLTSRRAIHITQTNSVTQTNNTTTGSGKTGPAAPVIFPVMAVIALAVVAVAGLQAGAQQSAQVSAVSQQALQTQAQIVQAYPQPQAPTVVHDAAPQVSVVDVIALALTGVMAVTSAIVCVKVLRGDGKRKQVVKHAAKQPKGYAAPLFNQTVKIPQKEDKTHVTHR